MFPSGPFLTGLFFFVCFVYEYLPSEELAFIPKGIG